MKKKSLNQIMNEMAQGLQPLDFNHASDMTSDGCHDLALKELSELEAFASMDDLLSGLQKEYLDAKAQRKELCDINGADDAMSVMALDMEDSAWCAMQTRYVELRDERKLMEQAQLMMRQRQKLIAEKKAMALHACKERESRNFLFFLRIAERIKEQNKISSSLEFLVLYLVFHYNKLDRSIHKQSYQNMIAA